MADQRSEIQNPKLRECANLLCDVTNLFLSDDDIHIKNTIISDKELVVGELESRMKDAREIIRDLTKSVVNSQQQLENVPPSDRHTNHMNELESEYCFLSEEVQKLQNRENELENSIYGRHQEIEKSEEQIKQTIESDKEFLPQIRWMMSLYSQATKISWDFKSEDIRGIFCDEDFGIAFPFEIDSSELSPTDLADRLWDISDTIYCQSQESQESQ